MKRCRICGTENEASVRFCKNCGADMGIPVTPGTPGRPPKKKKPWLMLLFFLILLLLSILGGFFLMQILSGRKSSAEPSTASSGDFEAYCKDISEEDISEEDGVFYVNCQLLLTAAEDASFKKVEKMVKSCGGEIVGYISATNDYQLEWAEGKTFQELSALAEELQAEELAEYVSLAYAAPAETNAVLYLNDPWSNTYDAADTSGTVWDEDKPDGLNWWAEAIHMPSVWSTLEEHTEKVKVGIIDAAFDTENTDLQGLFVKTWNNPSDENGASAVSSLYEEAYSAYNNALDQGDEEQTSTAEDSLSDLAHATHVAGLIAAQGGNSFGITGICPNVRLYGYNAFSDEASQLAGDSWTSIFHYKYALALLLNEDVKVINISIGFPDVLIKTQTGNAANAASLSVNSYSLGMFLKKYVQAGKEFLIIKGAGNDSSEDTIYDASYDIFGAITESSVADRILLVGAAQYTSAGGGYYKRASFSNAGSRVDLYAPGTNILSIVPDNGTRPMSGTSVATPIVTGLAAMVWDINPQLSSRQVRNILLASTSTSLYDLDDEALIIRDILSLSSEPVAIPDARICSRLAQDTLGDSAGNDRTASMVLGMIVPNTETASELDDDHWPAITIYDADHTEVAAPAAEPLTRLLEDPDTGEEFPIRFYSYSAFLAPGTYTVEVAVSEFITQSQTCVIGEDEVVDLDFLMEPDIELAFRLALAAHREELGEFNPDQSGIMHQNEDAWLVPTGILTGMIRDFDGDEVIEMLVCSAQPVENTPDSSQILLSMYEYVDGEVLLADSFLFGAYFETAYENAWNTAVTLSRNEWQNVALNLSALQANGQYYIIGEDQELAAAFANGSTQGYWGLLYNGNEFQYGFSFTQTEGGSCDFAYTGYTFEQGSLASSTVYYSEYREIAAPYDDFSQALTAFFGSQGIQIASSGQDYNLSFRSVLENTQGREKIFEFCNTIVSSDSASKAYQFHAALTVGDQTV